MKVIKYRLWNGSSMEEVGEITFHTDGSYHVNGEYPVNDKTMEEKFGGNKYYLMQFTGLLDKSGKEVFEGDILSSPHGNFEAKENLMWDEKIVEVIGNVYESKHLLDK